MLKMANRCARLGAAVLLTLLPSSSCSNAPLPGPQEDVGEARSAVVVNGNFEVGAPGAPPPSWIVQPFLGTNPGGITVQTPQTRAGLNLLPGGLPLTVIMRAAAGPLTQVDASLGAAASLRWPRYGNQCTLVNQLGANHNVNSMSQTMTIAAGDVDPTDGLVHIRFVTAPVLQNPVHPQNQQPYYFIQVTNVTQSTLLYTDFNLSAQAGVPWKTINGGTPNELDYVDWSLVDVAPGPAKLAMGDTVKLEFIASGCSLNAHFGQIYVDGVGTTIPGLFVSGTGPAQANAGSNITYNMTYKNGSAMAETGVVIDFTTPPGTTFQSFTPPAGAACVAPPVGMAGTIVCTFAGPVPAGGTGAFTITVNINAAASGQVVAGNYDIHSTQETPLLGSKIVTQIGCALDADCAAGNWCKETAPSACTPKLPNGTAIPTDAPHMGPTLNGTCTAAAGALVCTSGVCDPVDNKCGLVNSDGPCTVANGGVVCRSGVCDPDLKCGYAVGDGPCTVANGGVTCRSGVCSVNNLCVPVGGCNVDADCSGGNWCSESTHTCTAKLANGAALPSDPPHVGPVLDGTCSAAAGALVCVSGVCDAVDNKCGLVNSDGPCTVANGGVVCRSGVCDPDLKCGYAVGDGPCSVGNAAVVCRSGACSVNLTCEPAGGCDLDADCSAGNWCLESTHTCTPTLANGTAIPVDAPHTNPTLDGTCSAVAATLVCASGVCDAADNECGYANGDGPCTAANAATVCRSGACSVNGTVCVPVGGCNVDADCAADQFCNTPTFTCAAKLANGQPVPTVAGHTPSLTGVCDATAGAVVCSSGVCDATDNLCGFANGDGPCTGANGAAVCRSAACATTGPNLGLCEECDTSANCSGNAPTCDPTTNKCIGCASDTDCGNATSGKVCDDATKVCENGCRGSGGNGCPAGDVCTSADMTIGMCNMSSSSSSSGAGGGASSSSSSSSSSSGASSGSSGVGGATSSSSSSGAGGGALNEDHGVVALGNGCACTVPAPENGNSSGGAASLGFLAVGLVLRGRRRRASRVALGA